MSTRPDQEAGLGLATLRLCDLEPAPKRRRLEERSLQPFSTALLCCVLRAERGSSFLIALGEVEPEGPRDRPQDSEGKWSQRGPVHSPRTLRDSSCCLQ